jgi:hypothetical protein
MKINRNAVDVEQDLITDGQVCEGVQNMIFRNLEKFTE